MEIIKEEHILLSIKMTQTRFFFKMIIIISVLNIIIKEI